MHSIGIDIGLSGAVAIIDEKGNLSVFDMPIRETGSRKKQNEIDAKQLAQILKPFTDSNIFVEQVHSMPGQGVSSSFRFGESKGIVRGVLEALGYEYELISPQSWKAEWGDRLKTKDSTASAKRDAKTAARKLAAELFPSCAEKFERVKDDGRAEATLIAQLCKSRNL